MPVPVLEHPLRIIQNSGSKPQRAAVVSANKLTGAQLARPFTYYLWLLPATLRVVNTQTLWPTKLKIFIMWPFKKKCAYP